MLRAVIYLVFFLAVSVNGVFAHGPGGESHGPLTEINESEASEKAKQVLTKIVEQGKLEASWTEVQPAGVKKQIFNGSPEWVITFDNPEEKNPAKQKLYVFISIYGQFLGANHTGS